MLNWRYIKSLPQGLLQVKTTAVKIAGLIKWVLDEPRELMLTSDGMLHLYHPDSGVQLNVCFLNLKIGRLIYTNSIFSHVLLVSFLQTFRASSIILAEDKESFTVRDNGLVCVKYICIYFNVIYNICILRFYAYSTQNLDFVVKSPEAPDWYTAIKAIQR